MHFFRFLLIFSIFLCGCGNIRHIQKSEYMRIDKDNLIYGKKFQGIIKPQFTTKLAFQAEGRIISTIVKQLLNR